MALQLSGISVAMGFAIKGKNPLDVREILDTIADRDELVTKHGALKASVSMSRKPRSSISTMESLGLS